MSSFTSDQFDLEDKTAVVIGATGELGGAIAEGLCRAGANTVIAGRNEEKGIQRAEEFSEPDGAGRPCFRRATPPIGAICRPWWRLRTPHSAKSTCGSTLRA